MKKQKVQHKRTGVKLSRTNRSKLRRSKKTEVVFRSPGPSPFITKGEDGKVSIINIVGKVNQKSYTTDIGKNARQANKTAKQAKKDRIKQILASAGFDPTIKYTRKEKKKFTRRIKNLLFVQPKKVTLTDDEIKARIEMRKQRRKEEFEARRYMSPFGKKGVQKGFVASQLSVKEAKETRKFKYVIQNKSENNPQQDTDFLTDYFDAETREDAKKKVAEIAKKYAKNDKFTGIRIQDSKDNNIIYYPKSTLLAAQLLTFNIIKI